MMWNPKRHLIDFSALTMASIIATVFDGMAYAYLLQALAGYSLNVGIAAASAALLGGLAHFILCRYWAFQRFDRSFFWALAGYILMSTVAALVHGSTTHALALYAGPMLGWGASKVVIFLVWTYPVSRFIVFGQLKNETG